MGNLQLSEEERERRRQQALALHSQTVVDADGTERRKFGGPQPGSGRPRKKRVSELLAEEAEKHQKEILQVFIDNIKETAPPHIRQQAARDWLTIEEGERKILEDERRHLERAKRDEVVDKVTDRLLRLHQAGVINLELIANRGGELGVHADVVVER